MRVAYFTNQYPAVSHTFIRREIQALETLGVTVIRYALWSSSENLVDAQDKEELQKTRCILKAGVGEILRCALGALIRRPLAAIQMLWLAMKIGLRSDRGLLRHFAYAVEATVLADWSRHDNVRHLHAHFGTNSAAIAMLASQISGIPFSFTAHGPEEFEKASLLSLNTKLGLATFAVCVSSFGRSQLMRWSSPEQWPKIALIHCGVNEAFLDMPLTTPPSAPRFVCVGRLSEQKAQLILVGAVRRLRDSEIHCEVVLAGDGPMRSQVEAAIRQAGLERQIFVTGWVSGERVKVEILASRALVLPSFAENMPVVIMEAMALGRPVISTYVAGIPELVQPGVSGWLVAAGDETALAEALREAIITPAERLATMGSAGHAHVMKHHNALEEARKLNELFNAST